MFVGATSVRAQFDGRGPARLSKCYSVGSGIKAKASLVRLLESGVACDIRTTVHDALLDRSDRARLASDLVALGVPAHRLQPFRAAGCTTASLL